MNAGNRVYVYHFLHGAFTGEIVDVDEPNEYDQSITIRPDKPIKYASGNVVLSILHIDDWMQTIKKLN